MTETPVLIVGAGPTGLVLALWLTKLGIRVRIVDREAEPGTTSRALAVQARTLEFYRQVGLADAVVAAGVEVDGLGFWVKGRLAARVSLRRIGEGLSPYAFVFVFPQDAHEKLLIERLHSLGVSVERSIELAGFTQEERGVRATLRRPDGSAEICEAAYLAGCDGASSAVRNVLGIGFPGGTYTGRFYVADVEASGPAVDGRVQVDLDESDFLILFPLKGEGRVRLVGVLRDPPGGAAAEPTFEDVGQRAITNLRLRVARVNWFSTYRVHHRVASHFRDRRVFLLGDAAHIHSPVGGQGMNTGIGDAVNLAWKLAAVLGGARDDLLSTYELERIGFARRLVSTTDRIFEFVTKRGPFVRFVRTRLVPRIVPLLFRLGPVRRFQFRIVSQTGIEYRGSPLSSGSAGSIRGGDRLPWVSDGPEDNFAPLASLRWQVHVYGEAPPEVADACTALGIALCRFAWTEAARRAGLARDAIYLVRPDGYVALAESRADGGKLRRYCEERGLGRR
ncbi:MAG TPA: FAD-dependent monooxygenase [Thermoanaerobaculia bacterium]|nr:FAD-dependent monooxygenase [Thermoanaerobaculia bacterium]